MSSFPECLFWVLGTKVGKLGMLIDALGSFLLHGLGTNRSSLNQIQMSVSSGTKKNHALQ